MLVQPTQDEGATSERLSEAQPSPSPEPTSEAPNESLPDSSFAQSSEVPFEQQPDLSPSPSPRPSPNPSPTPIIPDSIPEPTDQAKEIKLLKAKITKLKKKANPVIKHFKEYQKRISKEQSQQRKRSSKKKRVQKESVSKQGRKNAKGDGKAKENAQSEGRQEKKFEDIQALYEKIKRLNENFISTGSAKDERLIKKMNEKRGGLSKSEVIKEDTKEEVKDEDKDEESTRKRKLGTRKKMKSRKRRYIQHTSEDDTDKENDELRLCLKIAQDEEKEVDYEILDRKYPIIDWKTQNYGTKPQLDEAKTNKEINLNVVTRSNGQKRHFSVLTSVLRSAEKKKDKGKGIMIEPGPEKKTKKQLEQERLRHEEAVRVVAKDDQAYVIDWSDPAMLRYHAQLNRPYSVAEVWDQIQSFAPMDSEKERGSEKKGSRKKSLARKRAGEKQSDQSAKRQKIEDDIEKEELKAYLDLVPREEFVMEIESLCTKYPIVDWKTHVLTENFMYYQIFKADGSSKNYKIFSEMLDDFDRQDVMDLHRLVEERYATSRPEGYDLMLWGDLKILFQPEEEDEVWRHQHEYNLIRWRLFDSCGIHILLMDNGIAIHMMIEKKYPLTQEMLSKMLNSRDRLSMVYAGDDGQALFTSHAWRRLFEVRGPLVREFILEFLSTYRMSDTEMGLDVADILCFQLGGARKRMT
ncbi:hypothetical protein Tco_1184640 [Tanacetum coccineum]